MNAIVIIGNRSWRSVLTNVVHRTPGAIPDMIIGIEANSAARNTRVPAAARKSSLYVSGYAVDAATTGGSRCTTAAGCPSWMRYAPGQWNSQTGKRKPWGLTATLGPIHGS